MNDDLRDLLLALLAELAPETDPATLDPEADLRDELDLDSMDLLELATRLEDALGFEVPERDYPHLRTLAGATRYLADRRTGARA